MAKYKIFTVQIPVDENGELLRRLKELAQSLNMQTEDVVDQVVQLGIYGHMEANMALYAKSHGCK